MMSLQSENFMVQIIKAITTISPLTQNIERAQQTHSGTCSLNDLSDESLVNGSYTDHMLSKQLKRQKFGHWIREHNFCT